MDFFAAFSPQGAREAWMLEAIAVLVALVLALAVRIAAPRGAQVRLRAIFISLGLNIAFYLLAELVASAAVHSIFAGLAMIFIAFAYARISFLLAFDVLLARNRARPLPRIVRDLSQGAILLVAALLSLRAAGVEPGQLLTTSALLTVVAGMALQETLGNLVAGLAIQTEHPFEVGDWIEVHGTPSHLGRVREINWRATHLHTLDNVDVVVPNGLLAKASVTNYDRPFRAARRSIYFHTPYSAPTRAVHEAVLGAIGDAPGVLQDPPPSLVTFAFTESGVQYWLRFFLDEMGRRDAIDGGVRDRVWYALARRGIPLSFPSRTVHVHEISESSEQVRSERALEDRIAALAKIELFAQLGPAELKSLAERAHAALFAPGEVVIRQGDKGESMFVVRRGEVSVRLGEGGGQEAEAARLREGAFFGEMSLLTGDPRRATVVAVSPCELLVVDHAAFRTLLAAHPEVAQHVGEKVVEREKGLLAARSGSSEPAREGGEASVALVQRIRRFFGLRA